MTRGDTRTNRWRRALGALAITVTTTLVLGLGFPRPAAGAPPAEEGSSPAALAERLFDEGAALFERRSFTAACGKFADSHALDPKLGTLLNLAFCHESEGKTARARVEFDEALLWAMQKGQKEREQFAREHLAALEKRLAYLVLEPPDAPTPGLETRIDGEVIPRARWGSPFVIDPGLHNLVASGPEREPQPILFYVAPGPSTRTLRVPSLVVDPMAAKPAAAPAPVPRDEEGPARARRRKTAGAITLAAGAAVLGAATVLGASAVVASDRLRASCTPGPCGPDAAGHDDTADGLSAAAAVSLGVGIAAAAAGTWLLLTPPGAPAVTSTPAAPPPVGGPAAAPKGVGRPRALVLLPFGEPRSF